MNVGITALRKLAVEAADNGLLAPELANGITRVKGVAIQGSPPRQLALDPAGAEAAQTRPTPRQRRGFTTGRSWPCSSAADSAAPRWWRLPSRMFSSATDAGASWISAAARGGKAQVSALSVVVDRRDRLRGLLVVARGDSISTNTDLGPQQGLARGGPATAVTTLKCYLKGGLRPRARFARRARREARTTVVRDQASSA